MKVCRNKTRGLLLDALFHLRLAETAAWCSSQNLVSFPEEDANAIQRRDMSRRAAELLSLAYRTDPYLFERRNWVSRLMNWSKIRRASKMKGEAESLFAMADPGFDRPAPTTTITEHGTSRSLRFASLSQSERESR